MTAEWGVEGQGVEGLSRKGNGLLDTDCFHILCGDWEPERGIRGLNGNGKRRDIKKKLLGII